MEMEIVPGKGNHERYICMYNIYVLLITISVKITQWDFWFLDYLELRIGIGSKGTKLGTWG